MRSLIITPHARLGPALFVLVGLACAYLGCWLPLWRDRIYPPEFDTRIGFVIAGFAPVTTGSALLASFGYLRLLKLQCTSPTTAGHVLLVLLFLPLIGSVATGTYLAPAAVVMLPDFVASVLDAIFGTEVSLFVWRFPWLATALIILLPIAGVAAWRWRLRRVRR